MEKSTTIKSMRSYYNVQYIVVEKVSNKVLKIDTQVIKKYDMKEVGLTAADLEMQYWNSYIMIKIY